MAMIWPRFARDWRPALTVLAIYALVLNAIFGAAATAAVAMGGDAGSIICRADLDQSVAGKVPGKLHEDCRACQGLCAQHGFHGIDPAARAQLWFVPEERGLILPREVIALPIERAAARAGHARAPPRLASKAA
jgi:hypothetical protein